MPTIVVGFSTTNLLLSRLIRWVSNSDVSHCYILVPVPEYDTSVVFQAQGFNVHYKNYDYFCEHATVVKEVHVEVTEEQYREAERVRVTECGKPYSYLELVGYLWVLLGNALGKYWRNPFYDEDKSFVCVELICRCLGIEDTGTLSPEDLFRMLRDRGVVHLYKQNKS